MEKTNIIFDNQNYSIDESALSAPTTALQSHLSTVMNGTGASVNLSGTTYDVDSTKLSTTTNAFTSYLGTIAGNGMKVIVNGVEYSIDSAKVSNAISALHAYLGSLQSGGSDTGEIKLNQYGFYYNVPYVSVDEEFNYALVFYEDNTMERFERMNWLNPPQLFPMEACFYEYTYDEEARSVTTTYGDVYQFIDTGSRPDGEYLEDEYMGVLLADKTIVPRNVEYGKTYTYDGLTFVFNEDSTVTIDGSETFEITWKGHYFWYSDENYNYSYGNYGSISIDGTGLWIQFGE